MNGKHSREVSRHIRLGAETLRDGRIVVLPLECPGNWGTDPISAMGVDVSTDTDEALLLGEDLGETTTPTDHRDVSCMPGPVDPTHSMKLPQCFAIETRRLHHLSERESE
jgi:hypothetical protein